MKFPIRFLWQTLLILLVFASSCGPPEHIRRATKHTTEFLEILIEDSESLFPNYEKITPYFPGLQHIKGHHKIDSAFVSKTTEKVGGIEMEITAFYSKKGKRQKHPFTLYLSSDTSGTWSIYDSKGLKNFEKDQFYNFAVSTGCLTESAALTDMDKVRHLQNSEKVFEQFYADFLDELEKEIKVEEWKFLADYMGNGTGSGLLLNISEFPIPSIKYKLVCMDKQGTVLSNFMGSLTSDTLHTGDSLTVTVTASVPTHTDHTSINLNFDHYDLKKVVRERSYSGSECGQFSQAD